MNAIERFWSRVEQTQECWLWSGTFSRNGGYGVLSVSNRQRRAHRVALELSGRVVPDGVVVRHRCDNPTCVNPAHLDLGTHRDNARDRVSRGRGANGERQGNCRLPDIGVRALTELYASGTWTQTDLSAAFGVSLSQVNNIVHGRQRRSLQE